MVTTHTRALLTTIALSLALAQPPTASAQEAPAAAQQAAATERAQSEQALAEQALQPETPATQGAEEEGLDIVRVIDHHISDSHHWTVFAWQGDEGERSIDIPLPVMAYHGGQLLLTTSSSFAEGATLERGGVAWSLNEHDKLLANGSRDGVFDFSLTRNVVHGFLVGLVVVLLFAAAARAIKRSRVPHGAANVAEFLFEFVNDIAVDQIGKEKSRKFAPFLLTLFFFIWANNLLGLLPFFPGGTNLSGNIAFTGILAIFTFLVTNFSGNKHYWLDIFTAPAVPGIMKVLMVPLEIVTMFTRPFTLLIRLFANITGGHIIVISIFSMIFILHTYVMAAVSVPLGAFVFVLELLFGALQAYIFTILSALYIGLAVNCGEEE